MLDNSFFEELFQHGSNEIVESEETNNVVLDQYTINYPNLKNVSQLIKLLEDILRKKYGDVVRAKGELIINSERIRFELADNLYGIISVDDDLDKQQCVFIGQNINKQLLDLSLHIKNKKIVYPTSIN